LSFQLRASFYIALFFKTFQVFISAAAVKEGCKAKPGRGEAETVDFVMQCFFLLLKCHISYEKVASSGDFIDFF
jgi:hypothetical protein